MPDEATLTLISWNVAGRVNRARDQVGYLATRRPDVVALQEVTPRSLPRLVKALQDHGLTHSLDSLRFLGKSASNSGPRRYINLIASRLPLRPLALRNVELPWPERLLSCCVATASGEVELHNTYIPTGASHGWVKIETLEGLHQRLARRARRPRILCGDFNTPQSEFADGTVVTFGQRITADGRAVMKRRFRNGEGARWDAGERGILEGLAPHDLGDAFRRRHGYGVEEASWLVWRGGKVVSSFRLDHVFASRSLGPRECGYLHAPREASLSDHSALETVFHL